DEDAEAQRDGHPHRSPGKRLAHADRLRLAVEHAEVECEQEQNEAYEADPEPDHLCDGCGTLNEGNAARSRATMKEKLSRARLPLSMLVLRHPPMPALPPPGQRG